MGALQTFFLFAVRAAAGDAYRMFARFTPSSLLAQLQSMSAQKRKQAVRSAPETLRAHWRNKSAVAQLKPDVFTRPQESDASDDDASDELDVVSKKLVCAVN